MRSDASSDPLRRPGLGQDDALPRPLPGDARARLAGPAASTRAREAAFLRLCLETRMPFVVDNTNPTAADRARYVAPARDGGVRGRRLPRGGRLRARRRRATRAGPAGRGWPTRGCATPRGGSCARRPRRGSRSSGTPPPRRTAAGGSSRWLRHHRCSERVVDRRERVLAQLRRPPPRRSRAPARAAWRRRSPRSRRAGCSTQASASWVSVTPRLLGDGPQRLDGGQRVVAQPLADEAVHGLVRRARVVRHRLAGPVLAGQHALGERRPDDLRDPVALAQRG